MNPNDSGENEKKKEVAAMLRSVIQSSKGGVHINNLNKEYMMLVGEAIPFRNLGYSSLRDLLNSMPTVVRIRRNHEGDEVVQAVADESTAHIASLVARQKASKPKVSLRKPIRKPNPRSHPWYPPHRAYGASSPWAPAGHRGKPHPPVHAAPPPPVHHPKRTPKPNFTARQPSPPQVSSKYTHNYQVPPRFQKIREPPTIPTFNNVENNVPPPPLPPPRTYREILDTYAQEKGLTVTFITLPIPAPKNRPQLFLSSVKILDETFSSFPADKYSKEEAEEEVARKAVTAKKIGIQDVAEQQIPTSRYETSEERQRMLARITEIVAPHEKGLWSHQVPIEYTNLCGEALPEEWLEVVKEHCVNIEINSVQGSTKSILYYREKKHHQNRENGAESLDPDLSLNGMASHDESETSSLESVPESLVLPDNQYWDVFVAYVVSTVAVVVRLVDYSEKYEELTAEMDLYYSDHKHPLSEVVIGSLCAVKVDDSWHRVQVVKTFDKKSECYFVDHGDTEILLNSQLHELEAKFLTIPFQALRCQLAGLEELSENPVIMQPLLELLGKTLVAEVVSREDPVSVILYDTSTDEDVNINEHLLDIAAKTPIGPSLPKVSGIANVTLTHITSDGEIYAQIDGPHEKHLYKLQAELEQICETSNKPVFNPVSKKIYAVKYVDGGWYRAVLTDEQPTEANKFQVFFIDYGNTSIVTPDLIRETELLEKPKFNMSPQAVKCCLHGVPPDVNLKWTDQATQKLNAMASSLTLLLKVVSAPTPEKPAQVELFKRIEPTDELVSINQTLALNADLFRLILKKDTSSDKNKARAIRRRSPSSSGATNRSTPEPVDTRRSSVALSSSSGVTSPEPISPPPESPPSNAHNADLSLPISDDKKDSKSTILQLLSPDGVSEGNENVTCMPPIKPPPIPKTGSDFDINVTLAANPNNFVCQPWANGKFLDQLVEDMQAFYNNEENIIDFAEDFVEKGTFYACRHNDGMWYRVYVQDIISQEPFMVSAYFVDFGDLVMVDLSDLQPLYTQFRELPFQAIRAALAGVAPKNGDWSPNDCVTFQNLIVNKQFVAVVKGQKVDPITENIGGVQLDLVLVDTTDPKEDVYVTKLLVEMGLAKPVT